MISVYFMCLVFVRRFLLCGKQFIVSVLYRITVLFCLFLQAFCPKL